MICALGHPQLVLAVDRRGGQEDVDPRPLGELDGLPGAVDVALVAPGQAADGRAGDLGGDGPDRLEVAVARRSGNPASMMSTPSAGQRPGHLELLGHVHARARRLLAVAQRRVEDPDPVRIGRACEAVDCCDVDMLMDWLFPRFFVTDQISLCITDG